MQTTKLHWRRQRESVNGSEQTAACARAAFLGTARGVSFRGAQFTVHPAAKQYTSGPRHQNEDQNAFLNPPNRWSVIGTRLDEDHVGAWSEASAPIQAVM